MLVILGCSSTSKFEESFPQQEEIKNTSVKILSLGDSYTIGESVCNKCNFPEQLRDSLQQKNKGLAFNLQIIARTGWTTTNLINAIENQNLATDFNLVTLLIGVNNQFQRLPFSIFQKEFSILVDKATLAVQSSKNKLIVLSIPDYAFTPFGGGNQTISNDIEKYNSYIKEFCANRDITFLNITDITKAGLENPELVANDGLHPSKTAYTAFVKRILLIASQKIGL